MCRLPAAGQVSWDVVKVYIKAMGGLPTFLVLVAGFLLAEAARVGATVWLSHWTGVADMPGALPALAPCLRTLTAYLLLHPDDRCSTRSLTVMPDCSLGGHHHMRTIRSMLLVSMTFSEEHKMLCIWSRNCPTYWTRNPSVTEGVRAAGAHKAMWYLTIYAGISGAQTALELVRGFSSNFLAIRAARHLHNGMLARLLRCVRDLVCLVHAYARLGSSRLVRSGHNVAPGSTQA